MPSSINLNGSNLPLFQSLSLRSSMNSNKSPRYFTGNSTPVREMQRLEPSSSSSPILATEPQPRTVIPISSSTRESAETVQVW